MKTLYHFLGSLTFALILIASTALFVTIGTFLESTYDSHLFAAQWIYENPLFSLLLGGFFVNILFSSLKRWPFKGRHIPFLITHLGLLMIIAGVFVKIHWGLQGIMLIGEGAGSQTVILPETYALHIKERAGNSHIIPLKNLARQDSKITIDILESYPHSHTRWESWLKSHQGHYYLDLMGLPSLSIDSPLQLDFTPYSSYPLTIQFIANLDEGVIRQKFIEGTTVIYTSNQEEKILSQHPLEVALNKNLHDYTSELLLNFSSQGFKSPQLVLKGQIPISIDLDGPKALINQSTSFLGAPPVSIELKRHPLLLFWQNADHDIAIIFFNEHGEVFSEFFQADSPERLMVYDQGFGGYTFQTTLPAFSFPHAQKQREEASIYHLTESIKFALKTNSPTQLSPPLNLWEKACERSGQNFIESFVSFLTLWHQQGGWIFNKNATLPSSLEQILKTIDWQAANLEKNCQTAVAVFEEVDNRQMVLSEDFYRALTYEIFQLGEKLNPPPFFNTPDPILLARYFSALLRFYDIHLSNLIRYPSSQQEAQKWLKDFLKIGENTSPLTLETPAKLKIKPASPSKKLEGNIPALSLLLKHKGQEEVKIVTYERAAKGLFWPVFEGMYAIRYQPCAETLSHRLRVRQARQINYPGTSQPFSYECDIEFTDTHTGKILDKTLSMNHVHETWQGHRFYLSNITSSQEGEIKKVQIAVNYDPAKYLLTYPGGLILTLGVFLLFWLNPYKNNVNVNSKHIDQSRTNWKNKKGL